MEEKIIEANGHIYILRDDGSKFVDCQIARDSFDIKVRVQLLNSEIQYEQR